LGDSGLIDDGTQVYTTTRNLAIGTTSAGGVKARVTGGAAGNWTAWFTGSSTVGQSYGLLLDGGTNASDTALQIRSAGGSTLMFVRGDGNVGIGTASPQDKCQVYGNLKVGVYASGSFVTLGDEGSTQKNVGVFRGASDNDLQLGGYNAIRFNVGAAQLGSQAERMRIDSSGLVGIRQATPSAYLAGFNTLVVGDPALSNTGITLASGTASDGTFAFADGTAGNAAYRGYIQYKHATDTMQIGTAASPQITILSTGNVGIGTASPSGRLHVVGGTAAASTNGAPVTIIAQSGGTGNTNGGSIVLTPGTQSGTGTVGLVDLSGPTGTGLKLPATPGNADTQTLDCYQEGTWTPTRAGFGGTNPTVTASYTRVGRLVTIAVTLTATGGNQYSSALGSTTLTVPSTMTPSVTASSTMTNGAVANVGNVAAFSDGFIYLPTFGLTTSTHQFTITYSV